MALQFASRLPQGDANSTTPNQDNRPRAQVWLNVGTTVDIPNPTTGEVESVFVALPVGIPLDTMEHMETRGTNKNWAHMVQAKNWLLDQLKAMGEGIEAGGEEIVDGLQIQVKRVGSASTPAADENPLLAAMQGSSLRVVK